MTAVEKIKDFLRQNAGQACCDDCLSALLKIKPRQQVQQKTRSTCQGQSVLASIGYLFEM
jgi:hypothetical protein